MNLQAVKQALSQITEVQFILPNGRQVPAHFHITEVGKITKHYIDCGGQERQESVISFQLFTAKDFDHRLSAAKLRSIVEMAEQRLGLSDAEVEVEHQGMTIQKFGLSFDGTQFRLLPKQTDCLAKDKCGIEQPKPKIRLSSAGKQV